MLNPIIPVKNNTKTSDKVCLVKKVEKTYEKKAINFKDNNNKENKQKDRGNSKEKNERETIKNEDKNIKNETGNVIDIKV